MKEMAKGINELGKGYVRRVGKAEYLEKKGEASDQRRLPRLSSSVFNSGIINSN